LHNNKIDKVLRLSFGKQLIFQGTKLKWMKWMKFSSFEEQCMLITKGEEVTSKLRMQV
jgi:hypothetical protein